MRVLVVFGGRSGEHEVSVSSARCVADALEALGHEVVGVGISRAGRWVRCHPREVADRVPEEGEPYVLLPDPQAPREVDLAFPALHGPYGEDGCIQGLFELAGLPYVGAGVEGSAVGMNKALHKRLFAEAGLPVVELVDLTRSDWERDPEEAWARAAKLGWPCFVKPARLGSSVGISKVHDESELRPAIERALRHDDLILVEAYGGPRELEVAALGDDPPELSVVGEIVPSGEFYDYRSKYADPRTRLVVPAELPPAVDARLRDLARAAFRAAACEGLARIDFFWDPGAGRVVVNEINTMPGLTPHSMFPRLWEASGLAFPQVVERLCDHALRRHARRSDLERRRAQAHREEVSSGGPPGR